MPVLYLTNMAFPLRSFACLLLEWLEAQEGSKYRDSNGFRRDEQPRLHRDLCTRCDRSGRGVPADPHWYNAIAWISFLYLFPLSSNSSNRQWLKNAIITNTFYCHMCCCYCCPSPHTQKYTAWWAARHSPTTHPPMAPRLPFPPDRTSHWPVPTPRQPRRGVAARLLAVTTTTTTTDC